MVDMGLVIILRTKKTHRSARKESRISPFYSKVHGGEGQILNVDSNCCSTALQCVLIAQKVQKTVKIIHIFAQSTENGSPCDLCAAVLTARSMEKSAYFC